MDNLLSLAGSVSAAAAKWAQHRFAKHFADLEGMVAKIAALSDTHDPQSPWVRDKYYYQRAMLWVQSVLDVCQMDAEAIDESVLCETFESLKIFAPDVFIDLGGVPKHVRNLPIPIGSFGVDIATLGITSEPKRRPASAKGMYYLDGRGGRSTSWYEVSGASNQYEMLDIGHQMFNVTSNIVENVDRMRKLWIMRHPNIATLVGGRPMGDPVDDGTAVYPLCEPYLLFPALGGARTLAESTPGILPSEARFQIVEQIAAGIAYVHESNGYFDTNMRLSPSAIWVTASGVVKISLPAILTYFGGNPYPGYDIDDALVSGDPDEYAAIPGTPRVVIGPRANLCAFGMLVYYVMSSNEAWSQFRSQFSSGPVAGVDLGAKVKINEFHKYYRRPPPPARPGRWRRRILYRNLPSCRLVYHNMPAL